MMIVSWCSLLVINLLSILLSVTICGWVPSSVNFQLQLSLSRHSINNYTDLTISWAPLSPLSCYLAPAAESGASQEPRPSAPAAARLTTLSSDRYLIGCPPPPRLPLAVGLIKLVTPASYWSRENKITAGTRGFLSLLKWCYKRLASTAGDHKIILKFIEIYYCWCPKHCRISKESS